MNFRGLALLIVVSLLTTVNAYAQCNQYDVTLTGTASGNRFAVAGTMMILPRNITPVTTNGINPIEFWLISGRPATAPRTGSIVFATNTAMQGQRTALDVVTIVKRSALQYTIRPDSAISQASTNFFNSSNGLLAGIYRIYQGAMTLDFSSDARSISGSINVTGRGFYYYQNVPYVANYTGRFVRTVPMNQCESSAI